MHAITRNKLLLATFIMTLLYALHYGIPLYATSSFLATYFSSTTVSALYVAGSILTLLVSLRVTRYIRRYHTYHFTVGLVLAEIAVTLLFALSKNPLLIGLFFVLHFCIQAMIYIILNIFIETFTKHAETGAVRGIFLTLLNLGILIAPLIGGTFLSREGFEALYIVASLALIPFLYFLTWIKPWFHRMSFGNPVSNSKCFCKNSRISNFSALLSPIVAQVFCWKNYRSA
jgi:predicted MFS family arabinose efflux permease